MGDGKKTKERLIIEALELFVRRGYHGTSIDHIVRKVGLTKGAFYSHFNSKGELLLEIRKDVGNKDTKLNEFDMLRWLISDIDKLEHTKDRGR